MAVIRPALMSARNQVAHQLAKAPINVRLRLVGPYLLPARQSLLDEAEGLGAGVPLSPGVGHGQVAHARQDRQHHGGERGQRQPRSPVFAEEQGQYPGQQQHVTEEIDYEAGEEAAKLVGVAVDSLDHLTGRMVIVEGHVERQAVLPEIGPERVGSGPTDPSARVRGQHVDELLHDRYDGEERGGGDQSADGASGKRLVYEVPDYLRVDELQADAGKQQNRQRGHHAPLRAQVADEQFHVLPEAYAQSGRVERL